MSKLAGMLSESQTQMQASEAISSNSMRYSISENIQFSRLKNTTIFPPQASFQLYEYGFNDSVSNIPLQIDRKLNSDESNFNYIDSSLIHDQHGVFSLWSQSPTINYQSGPSLLMNPLGNNHLATAKATMPTYDSNIIVKQQQLTSHVEMIPEQPNEIVGTIRNARKRPIENIVDMATTKKPEIVAEKRPSHSEWVTNKKITFCSQEKLQDHQIPKEIKEIQKNRVPVRRRQKLAAKITALQKLVSPYGKTDTASVLHETSVFIKVLQDQIQNKFHGIRDNHEHPQSKIIGARQVDLRSKGSCLAPLSLTQNLIKKDACNHTSTHF